MPSTVIFAFGLFVTGIFAAGVYTYMRIKFNDLEEEHNAQADAERIRQSVREQQYRQVPIRLVEHH